MGNVPFSHDVCRLGRAAPWRARHRSCHAQNNRPSNETASTSSPISARPALVSTKNTTGTICNPSETVAEVDRPAIYASTNDSSSCSGDTGICQSPRLAPRRFCGAAARQHGRRGSNATQPTARAQAARASESNRVRADGAEQHRAALVRNRRDVMWVDQTGDH